MTTDLPRPRAARLITEALLCGLPASLIAGVFLPIMLYTALTPLRMPPTFLLTVLATLACSGFALCQYWRLVVRTVRQQPYRFGGPFLLAIVCAMATQVLLLFWMPPLIIPGFLVALSAVHFTRLQRRDSHGTDRDRST